MNIRPWRIACALAALAATPRLAAGEDRLSVSVSSRPAATTTFHCLGIVVPYSGDDDQDSTCVPRYRAQGEREWRHGHPLHGDRGDREFRGSLVDLRPGTAYEIELAFLDPDGVTPAAARVAFLAETWSERFPIARTVWIEPGVHRETLVVEGGGTPSGYVLYSARPGRGRETVIDVGGASDNDVTVTADYVIVRGLTLANARTHAVEIRKSHHVVVERCKIEGWGREGGRGRPGNLDAGVYARDGGAQIVVQDSVIGPPRGSANDWKEGHPEGPQGVSLVETDGNHVIRYNDFASVEGRRFNDAVGGGWNFEIQGFPYRDSDIYGNRISDAADDGIECDGGDLNVRIWGNRIERVYSGISLAPVIKGPAYVWRNVVSDFGGAAFKLGEGDRKGYGALFLYHNTVYSAEDRSGIADWGGEGLYRHTTTRNNVLAVGNGPALSDKRADPTNSFDRDLVQGRIKVAGAAEPNGVRGEPDFVDPGRGDFRLGPGSRAIDRGVPLPGFNDGWRGASPDLGACEAGTAPPRYGPRPE